MTNHSYSSCLRTSYSRLYSDSLQRSAALVLEMDYSRKQSSNSVRRSDPVKQSQVGKQRGKYLPAGMRASGVRVQHTGHCRRTEVMACLLPFFHRSLQPACWPPFPCGTRVLAACLGWVSPTPTKPTPAPQPHHQQNPNPTTTKPQPHLSHTKISACISKETFARASRPRRVDLDLSKCSAVVEIGGGTRGMYASLPGAIHTVTCVVRPEAAVHTNSTCGGVQASGRRVPTKRLEAWSLLHPAVTHPPHRLSSISSADVVT